MSAATKVSVVMPVYNRERYVQEAVESILATGYSNLEIVIVNDGSTDHTPGILAALRAENPDIVRLVGRPGRMNRGSQASANEAIAVATGEYLCFLDSDDVMLPYRFDVAVPTLDEDPALDGVVEAVEILFEDEEDRRRWGDRPASAGPRIPTIDPDRFLEAWLIDRQVTFLTGAALLVRTRHFDRSGLYRVNRMFSEDYHLWIRLVACGRFAAGEIERPIVRYRRHAENMYAPRRWDSLRDLEIQREVLAWARRSPHVPARNLAVLAEAHRRKARWCLALLQSEGRRRDARRLAARLLARRPSLILDRHFVGNVVRTLLPATSGGRA